MSTDVTIDREALDAIRSSQRQGTEDLARKIIVMYLEDSRRYREEIGIAIEAGSAERVGVAAHSLKSCAANVGARRVAAAAAALELLGRDATLAEAPAEFVKLEAAVDEARSALLNLLDA